MQEKIGSYKLLQAAVSLSLNERQVFAYAIQQSIERELLLSAKETNDEKTADALFAEFETQGLVSTDIKTTRRKPGRSRDPGSMRAIACKYLSEHPGVTTKELTENVFKPKGKSFNVMYSLKDKGECRLSNEGRWYLTKT